VQVTEEEDVDAVNVIVPLKPPVRVTCMVEVSWEPLVVAAAALTL